MPYDIDGYVNSRKEVYCQLITYTGNYNLLLKLIRTRQILQEIILLYSLAGLNAMLS
jgi:hypothetical protein